MVSQATGNATFNSVIQAIKNGTIKVDFKYIFIVLGHNQVRSTCREMLCTLVESLVAEIRLRNTDSRIFISALLPRVVDNLEIKVHIVNFNRWLAAVVRKVGSTFFRVHLLAVQHEFLDQGTPIQRLFHEDGVTLSATGAFLFKKSMFEMAGFKMNSS